MNLNRNATKILNLKIYGDYELRITNIDSYSAYCDRLIVERIKHFFFEKDGKIDLVEHQEKVIEEIKKKMNDLFNEILWKEGYQYISEKRTFNENAIVEELDQLVVSNLRIGEGDRNRLEEIKKENPSLEEIIKNEKITRGSNEKRSHAKNQIDNLVHEVFRKPL